MENNTPLDDVAAARNAAADRLVSPWWYHLVLGTVMAAYVVATSFQNPWVTLPAVVVLLVVVRVLMSAYQRLTGVWVDGLAPGPQRRWTFVMAAVLVVAMLTGIFLPRLADVCWPTYVIAALLVPATVVLGRRFDETLRRSLREGA